MRTLAEVKDTLHAIPRPLSQLARRWSDASAQRWTATGDAPTFSEVLALAIHELTTAMEFGRPEYPQLLATWAVATYFFPTFATFPRLLVTGERGCGKSKLLSLLEAMSWNAWLLITPTPAVLFRLTAELRPTLLLDEMEGLNHKDRQEILSVLQAGYKAGASVPRCEGERSKRVEFFDVYGPMALAGIRGLPATTEDRCIPVVLLQGTDPTRINREADPTSPTLAAIRDGCYRLLLGRARDVRAAYAATDLPAWLTARVRELWKPLLAVADLADEGCGLNILADLLMLAQAHTLERSDLSAEAKAAIALATAALGDAERAILSPWRIGHPAEGASQVEGCADAGDGWPLAAPNWCTPGRQGSGGSEVRVTPEWLVGVTARYHPEFTVKPSPSGST